MRRRDGRYDEQDYDPNQDDWSYWDEDSFASLDHNRDGRIAANEWHFDRQSFIRADRNRDNYLNRNEFLAANVDDDRNDRFEYLDMNNDGRIERNEWHGNNETFDWLDTNNNGVLSRAEVAGAAAPGPPRIRTVIRLRASTTTAMVCSAAKSGTGRAAASMRAIPTTTA